MACKFSSERSRPLPFLVRRCDMKIFGRRRRKTIDDDSRPDMLTLKLPIVPNRLPDNPSLVLVSYHLVPT